MDKIIVFDLDTVEALEKSLDKLSRQIPFGSPRQKEIFRLKMELEVARKSAAQMVQIHETRLAALVVRSKEFIAGNKRSKNYR